MKKFNIWKVLDGLTAAAVASSSSSSSQPGQRAPDSDIVESLCSEHFQLCKTVRHGFPYQPSAMAFDPVQKILAIGTQSGSLRLFGRPGVECYCQHDSSAGVIQLQFLINEGALVSALADDTLHLWNLRQKRPAILHSLKFNKERSHADLSQREQRHKWDGKTNQTAFACCGGCSVWLWKQLSPLAASDVYSQWG